MSLPTLTDLKIHTGITSAKDDDELVEMLDAAIDVVEGIVGPISGGSVTEVHRGVNSDALVLRRMPTVALSSISARYGATTSPLAAADYELDADTGLLRSVSGYRFVGDYTVTYTAGRDVLPAAIRLAVLIIAAHLWETQRVPGAGPARAPGFGGADGIPDMGGSGGMGFAIPNRAQELLQPYMRPVIA